jgi:hypothetical protein
MQTESDTMNATERVRAALKAAGFNSRAISVSSPRGNVRVTIRTALAPIAWVRSVAEQVEEVRRDHYSGEILCGGNTFVDVEHHDSIRALLASRYLDAVKSALAELATLEGGRLAQVAGATRANGEAVFLGLRNGSVSVWDDTGPQILYHGSDAEGIAYRLACNDPDQSVAMLPSVTVPA